MAVDGQDMNAALGGAKARQPVMDVQGLSAFLNEVFPQSAESGHALESVGPMTARARLSVTGPAGHRHLRPGGTVSGPSMFSIADYTFYAATLGMIGPVEMAVTVTLNITFLRKPKPVDLICEARILKLGRRMSLGDCLIYSDGDDDPVAQAAVTYALPAS